MSKVDKLNDKKNEIEKIGKMDTASNEYFCCRCSLIYDGGELMEGSIECPNKACKSHVTNDLYVIRIGTIKFKQLLINHRKVIFQQKAWSSRKYIKEKALIRYQALGIRIMEGV